MTPKDPIRAAFARAQRAMLALRNEVNGDLRTSLTRCSESLVSAEGELACAALWYNELLREEAADEKETPAPAPTVRECECCGEEIPEDDVSICGGCNKPICPDCMGDENYCSVCLDEDRP